MEEWPISLFARVAPLRTLLMVLTAAIGSVTASASVLPYLTGNLSQKNTGSFILTVSPSSMTIPQDGSAVSTVTALSINSFSGTVTLSSTFTGPSLPVKFSSGTLNILANGKATSILNVTAPRGTILGIYDLVVTGTGTASAPKRIISSSASLSVIVDSNTDFGLYAQPYSITQLAGSTNSTTIILTSYNNFNGTVSLSATVPFGFIAVMGGQNRITLSAGGTGSTTLTISSTTATAPGLYNITVTGTSGQQSHSCTVIVTVVDPVVESLVLTGFKFNSGTNLTLYIENTGNATVTLQAYIVKDFAGDAWTLTSWPGPTIAPGSTVSATILVGASCSGCTYTWVIGFWQEFSPGQTYTVTVTTTRSSEFSFLASY